MFLLSNFFFNFENFFIRSSLNVFKISAKTISNVTPLNEFAGSSFFFLISFEDKSIGVYDIHSKSLLFKTEPNHSETIFDSQINYKNPNILATSSYDGSIKLWDLLTMKCISTIELSKEKNQKIIDKNSIIYGISWSPIDETRLVAATYAGKIVLIDTLNSIAIKEIKVGGVSPIHRVEWNKELSQYIACGSKEGYLYIFLIYL